MIWWTVSRWTLQGPVAQSEPVLLWKVACPAPWMVMLERFPLARSIRAKEMTLPPKPVTSLSALPTQRW